VCVCVCVCEEGLNGARNIKHSIPEFGQKKGGGLAMMFLTVIF